MKLMEAQRRFAQLEHVKNAYRSRDIGLLLEERGEKLRSTIRRLTDVRIIERVARDLYWHRTTASTRYRPVEEIAALLRIGSTCYVGMESAASRWGIISQIPVDRLTVVTSGREGIFPTPFGTIEFIHTAADALEIMTFTPAALPCNIPEMLEVMGAISMSCLSRRDTEPVKSLALAVP